MLTHRFATSADCLLLAELNQQLIRDEGHRNPMTLLELEERMRGWLAGEYAAVVFEVDGSVAAYALYADRGDHIYLRQLFVVCDRRRTGIGRQAIEALRARIWQPKRLVVEVLVGNLAAVEFWRAVGFVDYALTLESLPEAPAI